MNKLLIVSNRLPVSVNITKKGISIRSSVGGLATGMKSIYKDIDSLWIGWPGIDKNTLNEKELKDIRENLKAERCDPLYINKKEMDLYYYGFSNKTIWPLFHYFPQFTVYEQRYWEAYERINRLFAEQVVSHMETGNHIWIHDYHLLLLPKMIKDLYPDSTIGFFNHIPFPSFELFRLLPWRTDILEGMLGADLIGFHAFDYARHFNSCVRRLLGHDIEMNQINIGRRIIMVENYPMGIDYQKFNIAAKKINKAGKAKMPNLQKDIQRFHEILPGRKLILSIDRMDYTKGIRNRLYSFQRFLEKYPRYHGKVSLIMLAVPSRSKVSHYQMLKREVDELVGKINGAFGDLNWTPVWYFYRSMAFENLVLLYHYADVALITPLRDGMNLVAKEYIASKTNGKGVLILSEMAGSAKEMIEAILINPNNIEEIADAINQAVSMPEHEQVQRNERIQTRIKRYTVERWASDFMNGMRDIEKIQQKYTTKKLNEETVSAIQRDFSRASRSILFLDYNGTLVNKDNITEYASPDSELYRLLDNLKQSDSVDIALMSSRDRDQLMKWFGNRDFTLFAEHGFWIKHRDREWQSTGDRLKQDWQSIIKPVIESYVDRTPGSYLEEMNNILSWHYEKADPDHGMLRARELKDELTERILNMDLQILEGRKVIEVKPTGMNKGIAALNFLSSSRYDFIMAVGDDWTDEYLFELLPESAITIRVGLKKTHAKYNCETYKDVRKILQKLGQVAVKMTTNK
jgi:trehalose 6-phosphate synthase/phosphatase